MRAILLYRYFDFLSISILIFICLTANLFDVIRSIRQCALRIIHVCLSKPDTRTCLFLIRMIRMWNIGSCRRVIPIFICPDDVGFSLCIRNRKRNICKRGSIFIHFCKTEIPTEMKNIHCIFYNNLHWGCLIFFDLYPDWRII